MSPIHGRSIENGGCLPRGAESSRLGVRRLGALIGDGPRVGAVVDLNRALAVKLAAEDAGAPEAEADSLLPTITSRCRTIGLRPLPTDLIEQSLTTRWHVAEEEAHILAHVADGRLGWALQASSEASILETRTQRLAQLQDALTGGRVARFAMADWVAS